MFTIISLVIFWVILIVLLVGAISAGEIEAIIISLLLLVPGLLFVTVAALGAGWVMPIIGIWISIILTVGMIG